MSLSPGFYGEAETIDPVEAEKTLRYALDHGCTVINTADFYTSLTTGETYENLKLIGKVLKDYPREAIIITMKWGLWIEGSFKPYDLSPAGCKARVDKALEILGTDYIDVLVWRKFEYFPDIHNTSVKDMAKGMKEALDSGKVKAIGVSEISLEEFKAIHQVVPVSCVECEWNVFDRSNEKEIIPYAREIGAGILAYSCALGLDDSLDFPDMP